MIRNHRFATTQHGSPAWRKQRRLISELKHTHYRSTTSLNLLHYCLRHLSIRLRPIAGLEPGSPHHNMRPTLRDMPIALGTLKYSSHRRPWRPLDRDIRSPFLPRLQRKCQYFAELGRVMLAPFRRGRRVPVISCGSVIVQFGLSRRNKAREQVFNSPELLDRILSELELNDLLLRASLTCLAFERAIYSSPQTNKRLQYSVIDAANKFIPIKTFPTTWLSNSIEINCLNSKLPKPSLHIWFDRVSIDRYLASASFRSILMPEKDTQTSFYWMEFENSASTIIIPPAPSIIPTRINSIADDLQYISDMLYAPHALRSVCWFIT